MHGRVPFTAALQGYIFLVNVIMSHMHFSLFYFCSFSCCGFLFQVMFIIRLTSVNLQTLMFNCYNIWRFCTTGLPSDVIVEVGEMSFHLHKVIFIFFKLEVQSCIVACLLMSTYQINEVNMVSWHCDQNSFCWDVCTSTSNVSLYVWRKTFDLFLELVVRLL